MHNAARAADLDQRLPTEDEMISAAEAAKALSRAQEPDGSLTVATPDGGKVRLAPAVGHMIIELLGILANKNMVTIVPTGAMLTTQQAADLLNVSRPHLSKLLKDDVIEHIRVGSHRRVPFEKLMAYKAKRDAGREAALDELARLGQEIDDA